MKTLRDLLGDDPLIVSVKPGVKVRTAAKAMAFANVGCVAILQDGLLVGLFTERDILKRVLLQDLKTDQTIVDEVMTVKLVVGDPDMDANEGRRLLRDHHIRHLPVVAEGNRLLGVLSIRDLMRDELDEAQRTVEDVNRYIQGGEAFEGEV
ncbi:MAG TPA: CBS domain-containing protein [Planctomycetota bacterium]